MLHSVELCLRMLEHFLGFYHLCELDTLVFRNIQTCTTFVFFYVISHLCTKIFVLVERFMEYLKFVLVEKF